MVDSSAETRSSQGEAYGSRGGAIMRFSVLHPISLEPAAGGQRASHGTPDVTSECCASVRDYKLIHSSCGTNCAYGVATPSQIVPMPPSHKSMASPRRIRL